MTTKHTPGPCVPRTDKIEVTAVDDGWLLEMDNGYQVAMVYSCEKDARTFAAAPRMLEALELTLRNVESMIYMLPASADETERASLNTWAATVRAAIKAARGE